MLLLRKQTHFCVVILVLTILVQAETQTDKTKSDAGPPKYSEETNPQVSVKKDLEVNTESPPQTVEKTEKSSTEEVIKNTNEKQQQKITEKTGISTSTGNKTSVASATSSSSVFYHQEETILDSNDEISDSLKTGFYFFAALSLSAILFIVFKVYRLRLSRAERKYGVQGDRSNQELTPLPIGIEDGHSDDEDQTVFEVNRQNIRIL